MSPDDDGAGAIIRTVRDRHHPYILISRAPLQDARLTWEARGVLAYLLSKPDGWQIRVPDLLHQGPGGRDRMRRVLIELQQYGYLQRQRGQDATGRVVWISLVFETPPSTPFQGMVTENPSPCPEKPATEKPATENQGIYIVETSVIRELENRERESGAPAPAPSPPAYQSFAPNDDAHRWWVAECRTAGLDPTAIPIEPESARWRDEIAAGRRAVPVDPAADWRQWMRRAISWAHAHPAKELSHGHATDRPGPGAAGRPDPDPYTDEQFRADLAAKLSSIVVPPLE